MDWACSLDRGKMHDGYMWESSWKTKKEMGG